MLLALFCGFFVNLIKKSLTTRFGGIEMEDLKRAELNGQESGEGLPDDILSIKEKLIEGLNQPLKDCISEKDVAW